MRYTKSGIEISLIFKVSVWGRTNLRIGKLYPGFIACNFLQKPITQSASLNNIMCDDRATKRSRNLSLIRIEDLCGV